jgi:hypothetical protein
VGRRSAWGGGRRRASLRRGEGTGETEEGVADARERERRELPTPGSEGEERAAGVREGESHWWEGEDATR